MLLLSQRRLVRIAGYEAAERNLMHYEDMLAREAHRLLLERANEAREQGDMFMCEVQQRVVDDFWGIDKHNWQLQRDEERRKHIFFSRTEDMRRMMVHVGAIQVTSPSPPFPSISDTLYLSRPT